MGICFAGHKDGEVCSYSSLLYETEVLMTKSKMLVASILSLLLLQANHDVFVRAEDKAVQCVDGISTVIGEFTFASDEPEDYWVNFCTNDLGVTSMWAAAKLYCTPPDIIAGYNYLNHWCVEYGLLNLTTYEQILPKLTNDFIASLPVVNFVDINETKVWNTSVLMSKDLLAAGIRTTVSWQKRPDKEQVLTC